MQHESRVLLPAKLAEITSFDGSAEAQNVHWSCITLHNAETCVRRLEFCLTCEDRCRETQEPSP